MPDLADGPHRLKGGGPSPLRSRRVGLPQPRPQRREARPMNFLQRLFRSRPNDPSPAAEPDGDQVLVPIPALVVILQRAETLKGAPLVEDEVLHIRDEAVCMAMSAAMRAKLEEKRGYADVDPENVWHGWQVARVALKDTGV